MLFSNTRSTQTSQTQPQFEETKMATQTSNDTIDILVPDIGEAENVEIIEILVSAGDQVVLDDSLVTLESDKASMEIPASVAGVIQSITVNVGDTVSTGDGPRQVPINQRKRLMMQTFPMSARQQTQAQIQQPPVPMRLAQIQKLKHHLTMPPASLLRKRLKRAPAHLQQHTWTMKTYARHMQARESGAMLANTAPI